jgi:hypothetical protein
MATRPLLDPNGEWFEKCARHTSPHTARTLQNIFLCDGCAERLVREGLNGRPFIYVGETVEGLCGLCNQVKSVTLRQHFACIPCWTLVQSYQKGFVASQAVHDTWAKTIQPGLPQLRMEETEPIAIEAYARQKTSKKAAAKVLEQLDFKVFEGDRALFHIELKSGPASIDHMREFQLDVNDYDDIIGASRHTKLPSYIFHVQLQQEYRPPTRGTRAVGIWWTDFKRLRSGLIAVRQRRGEDKTAGYFSTAVFEPIETFSKEVEGRGYLRLAPELDDAALALPAVGTRIGGRAKRKA